MSKVNVYDVQKQDQWYRGPVIARVKYNSRLDIWDGSYWTNGGLGSHLGITQLRDGRYVLIHGTEWQGERDWAEVVSDERALQEILFSDNEQLLEEQRFARLKDLATKTLVPEAI